MRGRTHKLGSRDRGSERSAGSKQEEQGARLTSWGAGTEVSRQKTGGMRGRTHILGSRDRGQQAANRRNKGQDLQPGEQGQRE